MQGSGSSRGWLIHLAAGMALGAVIVLVAWIAAGGHPFGRIISSSDVSEPTTASAPLSTVDQRAVTPASTAARLGSRPPKAARAPELQFIKPKAKAKKAKAARRARTVKPKRATRPKRTHRSPVVRVVAPPEPTDQAGDAPVAALPEPPPAEEPPPAAAPAPVSGAGGGSAKPSPPDPVYYVGEG